MSLDDHIQREPAEPSDREAQDLARDEREFETGKVTQLEPRRPRPPADTEKRAA